MADVPGDFGFSDDHEILRDGARRFLEERCPIEEIRRLADDPVGHDPGVWKEMAELGWAGLTIPEAHGGAGLGNLHQALLLEEMGRRLLPSPYLGGALAALAIERAGDAAQQARWLPGIASGDTLASLGWLEPEGSWEPSDVKATARREGDTWVLSGTKAHVPCGADAALVVAPFVADGEIALFAIAGGFQAEAEVSIDPTRRTARLQFDGLAVPDDTRLSGGDLATWRTILLQSAAWLAAEMVGAAEATLGLTRDYAIDRKQFERQIGSFQAVKHPLVDDMIGIELARNHVYGAAAAFDAGETEAAETGARMAKAMASDVLARAVRHGVQFHGGYGFTLDCDMHFYFKRALFCRAMLGDAVHHRRHLAATLFGDTGA
ncbi:MAG: acyl-CoA/acyl-ACP dehydrogenase [Deltaproteobacteria bacterium]|nr:acyl-CoA/acyl-ACP dehydrogenase [Deltaproteobacteria bacterium]MBW2447214.1 acyl-CoA/acyl-ACP dehydrogenase [Deltaproteobacteria bacterium]